MPSGIDTFRYLWELTHKDKIEHIPLKRETLRNLLDWIACNMNKRLLRKLGITDLESLSDEELIDRVKEHQHRRTIVRKKQQMAAKKGRKKHEAGE